MYTSRTHEPFVQNSHSWKGKNIFSQVFGVDKHWENIRDLFWETAEEFKDRN